MIRKILDRLEEEKDDACADFEVYVLARNLRLDTEYDDFFHRGLARAKEIVQEVAKEYGKDTNVPSNWIPTAEMLFPKYGQKVLASVRTDIATHEVIITEYQRQEYWHNGIITAWCELPAPYQKGE